MEKGGKRVAAMTVRAGCFVSPRKEQRAYTHKKKITKKRRERERDGSIGQAFLECVARRHFVGWPQRFFSFSSPLFFVAVITFLSLRYSQLLPPSDPTPPSFFFSDPFHPTFFIEMNKLKSGKDPSILSQWST